MYAYLLGGPHHGEVLALPHAPYIIDIGERSYVARHADTDARTIVYVLHEDGPAEEAGPSARGHGR